MEQRWTVCGTGHRPDKLGQHWNPEGFRPAIKVLHRIVGRLVAQHGPLEVVSGMALGFDMILAKAATELRTAGLPITLTLALPFVGQEVRWTDQTALRWYRQLREAADREVIVSEGGYSAYKLELRNRWMIDRSQLVLACWNGASGGTANGVRYARQRGVPIEHIYDQISVVV